MRPRSRLSITSILLVVIVLVGCGGLALLMNRLYAERTEQYKLLGDDVVWDVNQLDREARVFRHHLYIFAEERDDIGLETVKRRFDILWSRIDNMDKGRLGEMYGQFDGAFSAQDAGRRMLKLVEPLVNDLQPGDSAGRDVILEHLDPVIDYFFALANSISQQNMEWQENRRVHFEKTFIIAGVLVACIFAAGAGLIFRLMKNDYDLGQLTDNLKEKIRERTLALEENNRSLRMMSQALEQSPVSVILCDPEGRIIYVNPHFEEVTGYSIDEALGKNPRFLQSGLTSGETYLDMWQSVHAGKVWKGEVCNKRKDGQFFWEHVSLSPIKNESDGIIGYVAVKEDISQRKLQEEKLLQQANYDSLTGLPNRTLAMDRLNQAILQVQRRGGVVAVLFIDLDNFKHVNDTLGHQGGDLLLKMAARRFVSCLRDCDTAARFGGDEFLLILSELQNGHDAQPILQRIIEAFMQPFTIEGQDFYTTTSVGVSICPENGTLTGELLKTSDTAMYVAKQKGKNTYCFFNDHDAGDG